MRIALLLCLFVSFESAAQTYFNNIYGDTLSNSHSFTPSPDAYYLMHNKTIGAPEPELIKTDLSGAVIWSKTIDFGLINVGVMRIRYHAGSLYITGGHQNSGYKNFFTKMDTSGNVQWTTELTFGDININTRILPVTDGFILTGHRDYIGSHAIYTFDLTLVKLDVNGNFVWGKSFGDNSYDFLGFASAIASNGDILIAGNYGLRNDTKEALLARFDSAGSLLWMKTFADTSGFFTHCTGLDMTATSDGNYAIAAETYNINFNRDAQLMKVDDAGNIIWSKRLFQIGWHETARSILNDSEGNLVLAGPYYMGTDYGDFFASFDQSGNMNYATRVSSTTNQLNNQGYNGVGEDLAEVPTQGYIYSTTLRSGFADYHALFKLDSNALSACSALNGSYVFTSNNTNWQQENFITLPIAENPVTASAITLTTASLPVIQNDLCALVSLKEEEKEEIILYPNPASSELYIKGIDGTERAGLYSISGRLLHHFEVMSDNPISISALQQGIYILKLDSKKGRAIKKFIKF